MLRCQLTTKVEVPIACTQTLFYFSFLSFQKHRRGREQSFRARKKNKERLQTCLEKERFIKSLPHVNASSLSPQRLQYQLNWTNGIGDINALCNCLRYFTIKQQVLYVGAIALGNHAVPVKLPTLPFLKESKVSFL